MAFKALSFFLAVLLAFPPAHGLTDIDFSARNQIGLPEKPGPKMHLSFKFKPSDAYLSAGKLGSNDTRPHAVPPAEQIAAGQRQVLEYLKSSGGSLDVGKTLALYEKAGHFSAVHGLLGEGINADMSRQIGKNRQLFHEEVLAELARTVKPKSRRLGVNDFGAGADPSKVNAKTDIDFTLYPEFEGVDAQWLVDEYQRLFAEIARKKYGVKLTPSQLDIVAHRYDAVMPDWRQQHTVSDFVMKMRTGRALLKKNPEAYFLEGAYVQQIMKRSTEDGIRTFMWVMDDHGTIRTDFMNAANVRQYFYKPDIRKRFAFGAAVGNMHFYEAHPDPVLQSKYILRAFDDGAGHYAGIQKRGDYADIQDFKTRNQIFQDVFSDPKLKLPPKIIQEMVLVMEASREARLASKANRPLTESEMLAHLKEYHKRLVEGFENNVTDEVLTARARQTFQKMGRTILSNNILRSAETRLTDWLAPDPAERIKFVEDNGNIRWIEPSKDRVTKLQFGAFFEIRDSVEVLMSESPDTLRRMKEQNPKMARDIEIVERLVREERRMMLAPEDFTHDDAEVFRQKAARSVLAAYDALASKSGEATLWKRVLDRAGRAWMMGKALESYIQSRSLDAVVHASGEKYGTLLQSLRMTSDEVSEQFMSSAWQARIGKANSMMNVLTVYMNEGAVNEKVIRAAVREGLGYFPILGMYLNIEAGGAKAVANIVLTQTVPLYGQILLGINTAKGVVQLGGTAIFAPLKHDRVLLAYQGFLPPKPEGFMNNIRAEAGDAYERGEIMNTILGAGSGAMTYFFSTGRNERIESPRPALLDPITRDPGMGLLEKRKKVYDYFRPGVIEKFKLAWGADTEPGDRAYTFSREEPERLGGILKDYVDQWWEGRGLFHADDTLTVKRMMDEYYGPEMKQMLVQMLMRDYFDHKYLLIQKQEEQNKQFMALVTEAAARAGVSAEEYLKQLKEIRKAHEEAGMAAMSMAIEDGERIEPGLEILMTPRVMREGERADQDTEGPADFGLETGDESEDGRASRLVIRTLNFRARAAASHTKDHPSPFQVRWEVDQLKGALANEGAGAEAESEASQVIVTAILADANGAEMLRKSVTVEIARELAPETDWEKIHELLGELKKVTEKTEALSAETLKILEEVRILTAGIEKELARLEGEIPGLDEYVRKIETLAREASEIARKMHEVHHLGAERSVGALAEMAGEMEGLSLEICQIAQQIKNAESSRERHRLYQGVPVLQNQLGPLLTQSREQFSSAQSHWRQAGEALARLREIKTEIPLGAKFDDAAAEGRALGQALERVLARAGEAEEKIGQIAGLMARGDELAGEIKALAGPLGETPDSQAVLKEADGYLERIEQAAASADLPFKEMSPKLKGLEERAGRLEEGLAALEGRRSEAIRIFSASGEEGAVGGAQGCNDSTVFLFEMGQSYRERIEKAYEDARFCAELGQGNADRLSEPAPVPAPVPESPALVRVPDLRAMTIDQAQAVLQSLGLAANGRSLGDASRQDQQYRVQGQSLEAGAGVPPGTVVTLDYFGRFKAQADCSAWPGSQPAVDPATGREGCACGPGLTWDAGMTSCLDCASYQNNFYGLLQSGQFDAAYGLVSRAVHCPWAAQGQQDLLAAMQQATQAIQQQTRQNAWEFQQEMQQRDAEAQRQQQQQQQFMNLMMQNIQTQAQIVRQGGWRPPAASNDGYIFSPGVTPQSNIPPGNVTPPTTGGSTTAGGCPGAVSLLNVCAQEVKNVSSVRRSSSGGSIWGDSGNGGFTFNN